MKERFARADPPAPRLRPCAAHDIEACIVCLTDEFERRRASLSASRAETRRERREDGALTWEAGGEG